MARDRNAETRPRPALCPAPFAAAALLALALAPAAACDRRARRAPAAPLAPPGTPTAPGTPAALDAGPRPEPSPPAATPVTFLEDDVPAARARALAEHKALLVDAWAAWCHTCLSMRHFVLTDPALAPLAARVVFAAVDTDRAQNAGFLAAHPVRVWPTYYVLDPRDERVLGYLPGSASPAAFRAFVEDALRGIPGGAGGAPGPNSPADAALAEARTASAAGDWPTASAAYERAVRAAPPDWPPRSAALYAWMVALYASREWAGCARAGRDHLAEVSDLSDADGFSWYLLQCLARGNTPPAEATAARLAVSNRLRALLDRPDAESTADDRASAMETLALSLESAGDAAGARMTRETALALLERAAAAAPAPAAAATFDDGRVRALLALGRGDDAVRLLTERARQLPDSPEPPAALAFALASLQRWPEARAALDRALPRAYGPRRLRLLKLRAEVLARLGDREGQLEALREEVRGYESLPPGQSSPDALADATRRLDEAERAARGEP